MNRKGKVIRLNSDAWENQPLKDTNSCDKCANTNNLRKVIQDLKGIVENQNKIIMEALATHNILLKQLIYQETISDDLLKCFPLKSLGELKEIDEKICDSNRAAYIKALKALLRGKIAKKLDNVFTTEVIIAVNIDGIHGKQGLKEHKQFFHTLLAAIDGPDPTKELRTALSLIKKRHFHKISIQKTAARKSVVPMKPATE